ncbi:MAG: magnetochrome domain-containing protein, partial [Alphaproteobacteria bacterium]|nr:magnetochrome domain-containing protein [Alphaproteobacteria bacterium]
MTDLDQELEGAGGTGAVCSKDLKRYFYLIGVVALLVLFGALVYRQSSGEGLKLDQLLARLGHVKTAATPAHGASPAPLASPVAGVGWVAPPSSAAGIATLPPIAGFGPQRQEAAGSATFSHVALAMRNSVASVSASSGGQTAPDPVAAIGAPDGLTRFATPTNRTVENIGSGVVVRNDGYIVTNYHVVRGANTVFATILDDVGSTRYSAEIVKLDEALDLALLKVVPKAPLSPAVLGDSDAVMVADEVIAIGSPFGLDMTVSRGILSAKRKSMVIEGVTHNGLLQTDAAINQGNSGGPLVAANGAVIGINTAIYTPNGAFAGIGFAVPSNQARQFVLDEIGSLPSSTVDGPSFGLVALPSQSVGVAGPPIPAGARSPHADGRQNMDCTTCHDVIRGGPVTAAPGGMTVAAANMPPPPIVAGTPSPHTDGRQNMQCNTCHQMLTKAPAGGRTVAARNQMGPPIAMGMASPHRDNRDTMACATCHQMVPAAGVAPVAAAGGAYQFAQPPASLAMNVAGGRQGAGSGVRGMVLAPMTPDVAARL